jgi:sterol desaturase/sphingolipid hydroxylase (fatty acid hydroxylase superfamily)
MIALLSFWLLFGLSLLQPQQRQYLRHKSGEDWLLDCLGLAIQGAAIPLLQTALTLQGYDWILPQGKACLVWQPCLSFLVAFVGVDYLYYWVHRGLHTTKLFPIHIVHHTVTQMDMLGSSRNTLWSSLFIPYVWVHSLMLYLLDDPRGYLWGITLTYLLDLWRHSSLNLDPNLWLYALLNPWLILPQDHATHHRRGKLGNFGANFKLWDHLHQTFVDSVPNAPPLGIQLKMNLGYKLFFPFVKSIH